MKDNRSIEREDRVRIAFKTLGCKVNQYETEALKERCISRGYEIVRDEDFAHVYVINTCTVTNMADRKSRQFIRRFKKQNPDAIVAVTGCYAQIKPEEVAAIDGVNIVAGTNEKNNIIEYIENAMTTGYLDTCKEEVHVSSYEELCQYKSNGVVTLAEDRQRAYIKIQEGCNRFCSYCIIPYARGKIRSRDEAEILQEARELIQKGFKEIVLTGINTALYGYDKIGGAEGKAMKELLLTLSQLDGEFRIRLSSLEPAVINKEYVMGLMNIPKLCNHLHLSIQSGCDKILKNMNRHYTTTEYKDIVAAIRQKDPDFGITTDIIVGFPGEDEEDFLETARFADEINFLRIHPFKFSKRDGTKAAIMSNQVDAKAKDDRMQRLMKLGDKIESRVLKSMIGKTFRVLGEEILVDNKISTEPMLSGYTDNYIRVLIEGNNLDEFVNEFVNVRLISVCNGIVKGVIVDE